MATAAQTPLPEPYRRRLEQGYWLLLVDEAFATNFLARLGTLHDHNPTSQRSANGNRTKQKQIMWLLIDFSLGRVSSRGASLDVSGET